MRATTILCLLMPCLGACNLDFHLGDLPGSDGDDSSCAPNGEREPPVLTLVGASAQSLECHTPYTDPGATATDACFGDLSRSVVRTGSVNSDVPASYTLTYNVSNPAGQSATPVTRTVTVNDTLPPTLTLNGPTAVSLECAQPYSDPGITASDACAGDLTSRISRSGSVNSSVPGTYALTYAVSDLAGNNAAPVSRTVTVSDTQPPTLTLNGAVAMSLECATPYTDPGATASDACAGDMTSSIVRSGSVNNNVPASYTLTYVVLDPAGNSALPVSRTVAVSDTLPPTLTLKGGSFLDLECGQPYVESGAIASDQCRGDLTAAITQPGAVDTKVPANYLLHYSVSDGKFTASADRTVRVRDTQPPSITVLGPLNDTIQCNGTYVDPGAIATDACAGDLTASITATRTGTSDNFTITYSVTDLAGNSFTSPVKRTVTRSGGKPVLTLLGSESMSVECRSAYVDPGATATDACYGDLTSSILRSGTVQEDVPGAYTLQYDVKNPAGQWADPITRMVEVADTLPPTLAVNGPLNVTLECGATYVDPGATAEDLCAGPLPVTSTSTGSPKVPGNYTTTYSAVDPAGNSVTSPSFRSVTVVDTLPPTLELIGSAGMDLECAQPFNDPGATANDQCRGDLTAAITRTGAVNDKIPADYLLHYSVSDGTRTASTDRMVRVRDTQPPIITVIGPSNFQLECGTPFKAPSATANDLCDGPLPVVVTHPDLSWPGAYVVGLLAKDSAGNVSGPFSLTVTVADTLPPVIQMLPGTSVIECNGPPYVDPGATASDQCYGDLTPNILVTSDLDQSHEGLYTISYSVMDPSGNVSTAFRHITVGPCGLAELSSLSSRLADLETSGAATLEAPGSLSLRGTAPALNVFRLDAHELTDSTRVSIEAPAGSLVVVNIHGGSATFAGHELSLHGGVDPLNLVYNFVEATELDVTGSESWGTVLAPYAHLPNGGWEGGIYRAARRSEEARESSR